MNISSLLNFSTFGGKGQSNSVAQAAATLSPMAQAVQRADQRVQTEVNANMAQLSAFGQLKSSVSQVQLSARALADLGATSTPTKHQSSLTDLVTAVNTAISRADTTALLPGASGAAESARRVARDLRQTMQTSDVFKVIERNPSNHTLTVNAEKLGHAVALDATRVQAALVNLGQRIDQMASTELTARGDVTDSLDLLKRHASTLQAQQSALQSAAQATSAYTSSRAGAFGYGVGAYQSNIG
ncbi:MAG: hypothetical protein PHH58_12410 [Rhodoferax sp.]|nr:hypothetical protein [Rhodoferax sp.]